MKFNSQICTTKEQSERLLALGLKKDNCYRYQAHLEAKELGLPYVSYFVLEAEDINEDGSCNHWWNRYKYE